MSIDPEILLGLQNSRQNENSIGLQRQILDMQKLQVLNQVRISQGLPPLADLPKPPPRKKRPYMTQEDVIITCIILVAIFAYVLLVWLI
jgi:hypothetical protein